MIAQGPASTSKGVWANRIHLWKEAGVTYEQAKVILDSLDRNYHDGRGAGVYGYHWLALQVRKIAQRMYGKEHEAWDRSI